MVAQTSYCKRSDLSTFGTTADALEDVDPGVQDACILAASARIDGALKTHGNLPLVDWGMDITRAAAVLAAYDVIVASRGRNPEESGEPDPLLDRYKMVEKWLSDVADGLATTAVYSPAPPPADPGSVGGAFITSNTSRGWQSTDGRGGAFSGRRR